MSTTPNHTSDTLGKADKPLGQYTLQDLAGLCDAKGRRIFPEGILKRCEKIDFGNGPIGRSNHSIVYLMRALDGDGKEILRKAAKESRHIDSASGYDYTAQRNPRDVHAIEAASTSILKNVIGSLVPSVDVPVGKLFLFSQWASGKNSRQRLIEAHKGSKEDVEKQRHSDLEIIARFNARCAVHSDRFSRPFFSSPLRYNPEGRKRSRIDDIAKLIYFNLKRTEKISPDNPFNIDQIKSFCNEEYSFDLDELVQKLVNAEMDVEKEEKNFTLNHGDFRGVHIIGSKGREKIIDFELFGYHPRMHDLATYSLDEGGLAMPDLEEIIPTIALYHELYKVHKKKITRSERMDQARTVLDGGAEKAYRRTRKKELARRTVEFLTRSFIIDVHLDAGNKTKYDLGGEAYLQEFAKGQDDWTIEGALTQRLERVERNLKFAQNNSCLSRNLNGDKVEFYNHIDALGSLLGKAHLIDY